MSQHSHFFKGICCPVKSQAWSYNPVENEVSVCSTLWSGQAKLWESGELSHVPLASPSALLAAPWDSSPSGPFCCLNSDDRLQVFFKLKRFVSVHLFSRCHYLEGICLYLWALSLRGVQGSLPLAQTPGKEATWSG